MLKMKPVLCLLNLCLFLTAAMSQTEIALYDAVIPNSIPAENLEKKTERPGGVDWLTDVSEPTLTCYPVAGGSKPAPAVIVCPGGGYAGLSIAKEGHDVARELNKWGIAAFVLKYRMPTDRTMKDKKNGPLQDAQQAIMLVRRNAAKWNIDVNKVGIMGFSAGGHLAATAGTHYNQPVTIEHTEINIRPDFMILLYPVISFQDSLTHMGSRNNLVGKTPTTDDKNLYSNELQVTKDAPPAFIVHAANDNTVKVKNALVFYEALLAHKIKAQLLIYPSGGHGFGLNNSTTSDKWMEHCNIWLKDYIINSR